MGLDITGMELRPAGYKANFPNRLHPQLSWKISFPQAPRLVEKNWGAS